MRFHFGLSIGLFLQRIPCLQFRSSGNVVLFWSGSSSHLVPSVVGGVRSVQEDDIHSSGQVLWRVWLYGALDVPDDQIVNRVRHADGGS